MYAHSCSYRCIQTTSCSVSVFLSSDEGCHMNMTFQFGWDNRQIVQYILAHEMKIAGLSQMCVNTLTNRDSASVTEDQVDIFGELLCLINREHNQRKSLKNNQL